MNFAKIFVLICIIKSQLCQHRFENIKEGIFYTKNNIIDYTLKYDTEKTLNPNNASDIYQVIGIDSNETHSNLKHILPKIVASEKFWEFEQIDDVNYNLIFFKSINFN